MPRLTPIKLCIANLRGAFPRGAIGYLSEDKALAELKHLTGQDFGKDVQKWEEWLKKNPEVTPKKAKTLEEALKLVRPKKAT